MRVLSLLTLATGGLLGLTACGGPDLSGTWTGDMVCDDGATTGVNVTLAKGDDKGTFIGDLTTTFEATIPVPLPSGEIQADLTIDVDARVTITVDGKDAQELGYTFADVVPSCHLEDDGTVITEDCDDFTFDQGDYEDLVDLDTLSWDGENTLTGTAGGGDCNGTFTRPAP